MDNTHLSIDAAEERGFIHRDYIAHCLRWSHVAKHLGQSARYKEADVLDIGCGREQPLAKLLYTSRMAPSSYTGVDINHLDRSDVLRTCEWVDLHGRTDICAWKDHGSTFSVITCFEVLEHVEPEHSFAILQRIRSLLEVAGQGGAKENGVAFISTPVFSQQVGSAANHVNEMSYEGLEFLIHAAGLKIEAVYGTFASIRDYKEELTGPMYTLFEKLREYYDTNYLATIFAPLYPKLSRNCMWRLVPGQVVVGTLPVESKHSSSALWADFIQKLDKELM
jgi:SAM-dependent methyltransferase